MSVLQIFLSGLGFGAHLSHDQGHSGHDPLRHPDLQAMSLRELADLPLSPWPVVEPEDEQASPACHG